MLITKKKQEIPTPLGGPRVYKACENVPRYDQSSRLGNRVRYDRCQHRLLYVDQSSTFIILYYSVPVLFAHSVQGCLLAVIACSANSSWLCSSASGRTNGSNGDVSCTGWRRRQHQIFPNKSVSEAAALDEGMATARRSDSGLQSWRRQQRFHRGNLSALRQDLGYDGPWVCAACVTVCHLAEISLDQSRATRLQRIWFHPVCALCSAMFTSGDNKQINTLFSKLD